MVACFAVVFAPQALAATFTVTKNADVVDPGGCAVGDCSLRDAVGAANGTGGPDTIQFDVNGGGTQTITLDPGLGPIEITTPVTVDGTSQPDIAPSLVGVTIDAGVQNGAGVSGLELEDGSAGSTIRGLGFIGFQDEGELAALAVDSNDNTIEGNAFGLANGVGSHNYAAIRITGSGNTIGGGAAGAGNVIVDSSVGILVKQSDVPGAPAPAGNTIAGNTIGFLTDGTTPGPGSLGNGIELDGATGTVIGFDTGPDDLGGVQQHPELANAISGGSTSNTAAISLDEGTTGTIVTGNFLGANRSGGSSGTSSGWGISILNSSSNNQIGPGNEIAYNGDDGVFVNSGTGNRIVADSIHDNAGLGINLTPGGNDSLPAPVITSVVNGVVTGTVTGVAGQTLFVELFDNPSCTGAGGTAGRTYVTFAQPTIPDGQTQTTWTAQFGVDPGDGITATSTDATAGHASDTSQFSNCVTAASGSAGGGSLSLTTAQTAQSVDLTAAGSEDWAIWGYANNGTSTSLAPDARKVGSNDEISSLTDIDPSAAPRRGLGQFGPTGTPFTFEWSDGTLAGPDGPTPAGLEHDGQQNQASTLGDGFSFTVPAGTGQRTLTVYASVHYGTGRLTATLSDGSATAATSDIVGDPSPGLPFTANVPAVFTISYAAATDGQTLTVKWVETADTCGAGGGHCDDVAIYAAALSSPQGATGATATLGSDASVQMAGSNDSIAAIPLGAFQSTAGGATPAPINGLPINGLPINGLPINGLPINGLPINGLPINGLPINGLPINALPINGLPINGLPINGLPINGLPINALQLPGQSWQTILAGTPLANKPLQTVTLQQVLALNPLPAALQHLTLGQLAVADSDFGKVSIGALALGATPINALGLDASSQAALVAWCTSVAPAASCSASSTAAGTLGGQSLFTLSLEDAPTNGLPINGLPINGLPINGLPINGLPINALNLAASPINALPINGLPINGLAGIVNCAKIDCTSTKTLGDAAAAGAIVPGLTVGALLSYLQTDPQVYATLTLGDVIGLLINRNDIPWETLAPSVFAAFDPGRPVIHFSAGFTIQGTGSGAADVKVTLPAGFDFDPGSATLGNLQPGDPTITRTTTETTLEWQLPSVQFGTPYTLAFRARAGTDVGPTQATEVVSVDGVTSSSSIASFTVTDGFSNNTFGSAATVSPDSNVEMSAILSPKEVDYYKIPLPPAGTRLQVHLTNLNADYDLALYANQTTSVRTSGQAPNGVPLQDGTVADQEINLGGASSSNAQLTPTALQDVPNPGVPVVQVSANRGTDDEDVGMVSPGGGGFAYVAVFGYNGASSPEPYTLRVSTQATPQTANCSPRTFAFPTQGTAGTVPAISSLPANLNTLVLVDEKRLGQTYGTAAETTAVTALNNLAGRADLGISGAVIPVEGLSGVQTQYNQWDANPCNNAAANVIANSIADEVAAVKTARPGLKYVVFAGGDDEIPFFRIPDLSLIANESGFASQFSNNEYYGALSSGDLLTDNPYLDTRPVPASGRQLFVPDLVGGRLVETPTDIANAVTAFVNSGGTLRSSTAFVSGYDFVADGSQAVQGKLASILGSGSVRTLIDSTTPFAPATSWSKAQLIASAFPSGGPAAINDWNGHYDNTRALMANGTDILSTSELTGTHALSGGVFFTMGCHAGFQTTDAIIGSPVLDWAQYTAGTGTGFVGNTGFGLGNTDSVAFSEELMAGLASHLDGSVSLGQALVQAKQDYFLSRDAFSSYDEKTLSEAELYGLPMYGVGKPPAPLTQPGAQPQSLTAQAAVATPAASPDPVTGATSSSSPSVGLLGAFAGSPAQAAPFDVVPSFSGPINGQHGSYYTSGGQVQAPNYRPLQPYVSLPATQTGLVAHGVVIDSLTSEDHSPFNPDNVRPTLDLSTKELEPQFDDEAWPSKIPALVSLNSGASSLSQKVNLVTGQFFDDTSGSSPVGVERLWKHIGGRVVYSNSTDFVPPSIDRMDAFTAGLGTVVFTGQFSDPGSTIVFAQVVYDKEDGTGLWAALPLQNGSGNTWSGTTPFTGSHIQFFVEVCDAAGNCGYSSNKGRYFDAQPLSAQSGTITLTPTTQPAPSGFYSGPVTVDASSSSGAALTESLDGAPYVAYPAAGVNVTGDGPHTLDVKGSDGSEASTAVLIDTGSPTAAINVPASVPYHATVPFSFSCADAGSGIASCTGTQNNAGLANGAPINTSSLGTVALAVTATDNAGHTGSATENVQVVKATPTITWAAPAPITFGTQLGATQLNATASVPGTFAYSPAAGTVLQPGLQTLSVTFTPTDATHYNTATASVVILVTFSQACVTGTVSGSVTIKSGQVYCLGAGGKITGSVSVQSGGSLWVYGGTLAGTLSASGAKAITFCNASVSGAISISKSTGPVTMGATTGCGPNKFLAAMSLSSNTGGVSIVGNSIAGAVSISSNSGGVTFAGNKALAVLSFSSNAGGVTVTGNTVGGAVSVTSSTGGVTFTNNTIAGALSIQNNKGGFVYSGNHVTGPVTIRNNS